VISALDAATFPAAGPAREKVQHPARRGPDLAQAPVPETQAGRDRVREAPPDSRESDQAHEVLACLRDGLGSCRGCSPCGL